MYVVFVEMVLPHVVVATTPGYAKKGHFLEENKKIENADFLI